MRSAILLRHVAGLGFDDVARELAIPVGTAKTHVHRGLTLVRERLRRAGSVLSLALLLGMVGELSGADGPPSLPVPSAPTSPRARPSPRTRTRPGPRPPGIGIIMKTIIAFAVIAFAIAIPYASTQDAAAPGAAPVAAAPQHTYSGTVATANTSQVVMFCVPANAVAGSSLTKQTVTVNANTNVTIAGNAAKASDLKEGASIKVVTDGADVATSITAE